MAQCYLFAFCAAGAFTRGHDTCLLPENKTAKHLRACRCVVTLCNACVKARLNSAMTILENYDEERIKRSLSAVSQLLTPADGEELKRSARVVKYRRNEIIYRENEQPTRLLCLVNGKVKIYRDGIGGRSLINRVLRPVQYFGYRAYLAREPYVTAAAAFEESVLVEFLMADVCKVMERNAGLTAFFMQELAVDLGIADRRIVSLTQKHVRGRLAEALLHLVDVYGIDSEGILSAQISREDMASLSNMTTSNAIRTLSEFADEGMLAVHGRTIKFVDMKRLERTSLYG